MKKLGKLNLKTEKMLSHEELVNFKGGSDITCDNCFLSAEIACEASCGGTSSCDETECLENQREACIEILECEEG